MKKHAWSGGASGGGKRVLTAGRVLQGPRLAEVWIKPPSPPPSAWCVRDPGSYFRVMLFPRENANDLNHYHQHHSSSSSSHWSLSIFPSPPLPPFVPPSYLPQCGVSLVVGGDNSKGGER
ncbi:hypothetical protein E2C01_070832 [Portunus trituberculatus]|uniref:Uncharacterized protein n=1 Tax=Portunus trituberculatus TaxID=210409 RepID=A0A5B7HYD6_PORTR|nr:hypothetical protein [Portunus trituberculatus]